MEDHAALMQDLAHRRVLVLGLGVSGVSAANFCAQHGARVVAADERPPQELDRLSDLEPGVERALGRSFPTDLTVRLSFDTLCLVIEPSSH